MMETRKKRKRFPLFWVFYALFLIAIAVFWICIVSYVKKSLLLFEANQPEQKLEEIMTTFRQNGLRQYMAVEESSISRFETLQDYEKEFASRVDGKILFATKGKGSQDPSAPRYELYADGELAGYITLREASAENLLVFLTLSQWELGNVEMISAQAQNSVKITVPDSYRVLLNGQQMDERELLEGAEEPKEFENVTAYVAAPKLVTYEAKGLLNPPAITILDQHNEETSFETTEKNGRTQVRIDKLQESEMPKELADLVLENAERYTNFMSEDLPGCHASIDPVRDMFPEGSYYLEFLEIYRSQDMWMYSGHNAPVFKNEEVSHYIRYSDDLFSCEVYFDKHMYIPRYGRTHIDTTHSKMFYGLIDGAWKILDIQTLLEDQE